MQVRGLLLAVLVLGLLGAGVYWSNKQKAEEEVKQSSGGTSKLVKISSEDIRRIELQRRDALTLVLERDKANKWQMLAPETWRVDQETANSIAGSYAGLSYDRVVEEKPVDLAPYGLKAPSVVATVAAKDGKPGKLLIGDETPTGTGVYAKLEDDPRVFMVATATKTTLDKTEQDLRDKRLLTFEADKVTRLELNAKGGPVEFGRNARNEWQIVKPKPQRADNGQVEDLARKLADARMDTSETDAAKAAANFASATRIGSATVTDASGTQTLEVKKKGDEYFARSSAVPGFFKVAADTGEGINKSIDDFRNKKLFDFGFNEPTSVTIKDDAKSYAFQKSGDKWQAAGKQMDATSVQSLIDKLRDLTTTKFVESGFATPTIEIGVTSDSGKRVEKVLIAKSGDSFFARRDGEPTIYELDSKAVEEIQRAAADVKEPPPPAKK